MFVVFMRLAFVAALAVVLWGSLAPVTPDAGGGVPISRILSDFLFGSPAYADKVAHFIAYAGLGALAFWSRWRVFRVRWAWPFLLAAYGGVIEVAQGFTASRVADPFDATVNLAGAALGFMLALLLSAAIARIMRA